MGLKGNLLPPRSSQCRNPLRRPLDQSLPHSVAARPPLPEVLIAADSAGAPSVASITSLFVVSHFLVADKESCNPDTPQCLAKGTYATLYATT
ncbi:hypothetical protein SprV_0200763300 [Sparganum proliferum]